MDAPILLKAQIKGYAKRDGTFVAAHSDKRPGAKDDTPLNLHSAAMRATERANAAMLATKQHGKHNAFRAMNSYLDACVLQVEAVRANLLARDAHANLKTPDAKDKATSHQFMADLHFTQAKEMLREELTNPNGIKSQLSLPDNIKGKLSPQSKPAAGYGYAQMAEPLQAIVQSLTPDAPEVWDYRDVGGDRSARYPVRSNSGNGIATEEVMYSAPGWTKIPDKIRADNNMFGPEGVVMWGHEDGHVVTMGNGYVTAMQHTPGRFDAERETVRKMIKQAKDAG